MDKKVPPKGSKIGRPIQWVGCATGLYHMRVEWRDDGIHCLDCDFFKSKAEHMADLYAGMG